MRDGDVRDHRQNLLARKGANSIMFCCARRSRAADTIFIALVICCVLFVLAMRMRISFKLAIAYASFRHFENRFELIR